MPSPRHPRDLAFSFKLPDGAGPIVALVPRNGQLEVYTRDATYAAMTPDQLDKGRTRPDMPPAVKQLSSVGASSPIVARIYLQVRDIMGNFPLKHGTSEEVLEHFHACKDAVLQSDQIASDLLGEYLPIWEAGETKGFKVIDGVLQAPHVQDLTLRMGHFFRHAKTAIQAVGEAFNSFYGIRARRWLR